MVKWWWLWWWWSSDGKYVVTWICLSLKLQNIGKVDKAKLIEVGQKYVLPLFGEKARSAVVCHSEKAEEIRNGLEALGLPLTVQVGILLSI